MHQGDVCTESQKPEIFLTYNKKIWCWRSAISNFLNHLRFDDKATRTERRATDFFASIRDEL